MATKEEIFFAKLALQHKLTTRERLLECFRLQQQFREMGIARNLGEILEEKGYLKREFIQSIRNKIETSHGQDRFGMKAVGKRWITGSQLKECLQLQRDLGEKGERLRLGEIFMEKGYLTSRQVMKLFQDRNKLKGESIFGLIALRNNLLTRQDLKSCLQHQQKLRGKGLVKRIGEIMLGKNLLSKKIVREILTLQRSSRETTLGEMLVERRLLNREKLEECLHLQKKMKQLGILKRLGEILLEKRYLTRENLEKFLNEELPQNIKGYRILAKLSAGRFHATYRATHKTTGQTVAIKVLSRDHTRNVEMSSRFLHRHRLALSLDHPCLEKVREVGSNRKRPYVVLDFQELPSLEKRLKKHDFLPETAVTFLLESALGLLAYLHSRHLRYRYPTPENIRWDGENTVKMDPYALAGEKLDEFYPPPLPEAYYWAPERTTGGSDDLRHDLYALGVTAYRLLFGRLPFTGPDAAAVLAAHRAGKPGFAPPTGQHLSSPALRFLKSCISPKPEQRFPTPQAALAFVTAWKKPWARRPRGEARLPESLVKIP